MLKGFRTHDDVITVSGATPVHHALTLMGEHNIGALQVADGSKAIGIFTEVNLACVHFLQWLSNMCLESATSFARSWWPDAILKTLSSRM